MKSETENTRKCECGCTRFTRNYNKCEDVCDCCGLTYDVLYEMPQAPRFDKEGNTETTPTRKGRLGSVMGRMDRQSKRMWDPAQANRMRLIDKSVSTEDERCQRQAEIKLEQMCNSYRVPKAVREYALDIWDKASDKGLSHGKSREYILAVGIYLGFAKYQGSVPIDELSAHFKLNKTSLSREIKKVKQGLGIRVPPASPGTFIHQMAEQLGMNRKYELEAIEMATMVEGKMCVSGISPVSVAGTCISLVNRKHGLGYLQCQISNATGVSEPTLKNTAARIGGELGFGEC